MTQDAVIGVYLNFLDLKPSGLELFLPKIINKYTKKGFPLRSKFYFSDISFADLKNFFKSSHRKIYLLFCPVCGGQLVDTINFSKYLKIVFLL